MIDLPFQPTVLALPQFAAALLAAGFAAHAWRRHRGTTGVRELVVTQAFTVVWALMGALEFCAATLEAKVLCSKLSYIGAVGAPAAGFRFAWVYTGMPRPLPRWFSPVTLTWAALILLMVFANRSDGGLVWSRVVPVEIRGEFFARYDRAPGFWFNIAHGYSLTIAACALFIRHAIDLGGIYRGQSFLVALAAACPWMASLAYLFRVGPLPEIDNTPVGFAFGNLIFTWSLLRWRFLDMSPVATRTLFARMSEPVLVIDARDRLNQVNRAAERTFGLTPRRLGRPLAEALAPHPALLAVCRDAPDQPSTSPAFSDSSDRWWSVESTPLASPRGLLYGRLCVLHDITALVEARRAAEAATHAKTEFLSHVSHDLRTPLHSILVLAEILRAGPLGDEQRAQLGTLREAGQALLRLVNNLLDVNRLESGFIDLEDTPFRLADVLDPSVALLRVAAERKGLALEHVVAPGFDGALRGDADRLRQILLNLGGNAVKFTARGRVVLRAAPSGPADARVLRIEISDTGPGLPPGREASLFEPFVRDESVRKKEGAGLGLSIVRRLAEAMGGTVSAANRPEGGALFVVELPILAPDPLPAAPADDARPAIGLRALVVDDDPRSLAAGVALLVHCGCSAQTATGGEDALRMLATSPYDLVVLDGQMPGLDGIETTRRIRALPPGHMNRGVVVLGFTADPSPTRLAQWIAAGAAAMLAKPSGIAEFSAALARHAPAAGRA